MTMNQEEIRKQFEKQDYLPEESEPYDLLRGEVNPDGYWYERTHEAWLIFSESYKSGYQAALASKQEPYMWAIEGLPLRQAWGSKEEAEANIRNPSLKVIPLYCNQQEPVEPETVYTKFKEGDFVVGLGEHKGCSMVLTVYGFFQPFQYLEDFNPDNFRIATNEEIYQAGRESVCIDKLEQIESNQEAFPWVQGENEFKDWCYQWFGADADESYLSKAIYSLPAVAQNFKYQSKAIGPAQDNEAK
jgi:hypothetical protein